MRVLPPSVVVGSVLLQRSSRGVLKTIFDLDSTLNYQTVLFCRFLL